MGKLDIVTSNGTKEGSVNIPAVFETPVKKPLLHQAVLAYLANQRLATAHTKTKGEVSGGGRKPWRQKGTGRARAGSSRSPIWVGGGITFGPRNDRNYSKRLPVRMRHKAIAMALGTKIADHKLIVVSDVSLAEPKTKLAASLLARISPVAPSILIVVAAKQTESWRAFRNLRKISFIPLNELHIYDIIRFDTLIMTKEAFTQLGSELQAKITHSSSVTKESDHD